MELSVSRCSYFIAKCQTIQALRRCMETSVWACNQRKQPPQPTEILTDAFSTGTVYLIFSVNNCHGWHGCAKMLEAPGSVDRDTNNQLVKKLTNEEEAERDDLRTDIAKSNLDDGDETWHKFKIQWCCLYLKEHGEKCLPFSETEDLFCDEEKTVPLNKARNFQILHNQVGEMLVSLLGQHHDQLSLAKAEKKAAEALKSKESQFFNPGESTDIQDVWSKLCHKVSTLGKIHLACAFGSQRYNLHNEKSDMDMFVVYEADAKDVLCFQPPQQTIKNREDEACDYTVHEVFRYCELLLTGDPRCVETLFMHSSTIFYASEEWKQLAESRKEFLSKTVLEKYLRDGLGSKGIRLMDKLVLSGEALLMPMPMKVCKLFYIIIRLLQNALNIARGEDLQVYRPEGSPERDLLLNTRGGQYTYEHLRSVVDRLTEEIMTKKELLTDEVKEPIRKGTLEKWLLSLRFQSLRACMYFENIS